MITIPHYKCLTQINESVDSIIYRGIREQDNETVILKTLKEEYPSPAKLAHYQQEYNILQNLNLTGVIKVYALEKYKNTLVIIFEDIGGESLKQLITKRRFSIKEFLSIAIELADILGDIHGLQIIHKDINPSNIIWNQSTLELKIIDFGISTILPRENLTLKNPNQLEGTLAYISPEQTGRMNRSIDYRTDFYALGITFYELLTHHLPFETEDKMELVHCHLAKQPVPPHQLNPDIPRMLSEIIMKLLAKTAEQRYQSAYGLKADLQRCELALEQGEVIWTLGREDFCDKFRIPQKLYGRDKEIDILLSAFNRASQQRSELMLVAGYSGIGKSALVREIYKPITEKRGYFIAGKFDQVQRNIPYSAVVNAFRDLMRQLMTEGVSQLEQWREKILKAVGPNGQIIIDVIPEVQLIIDKQEAVPKLGPTEALNRFNLVFQNFIRVFCDPEHPLVIFLDDLQWADSASLKLMTLMMAHSQYLFLIGAYRDNEVNGGHPLSLTLEELNKSGLAIETLTLGPLGLAETKQLIADTLNQCLEKTETLADLVLKKTGGNPFFMGEFLKELYRAKLIDFKWGTDDSQPGWQWDLTQIEARGMTDNVIDLMVDKVEKLNPNTQQVLKWAACIGNQFDLNLLAIVCQKTCQAIQEDLWEAISEEMIFQTDQNYKFVHDRVQQAVYSLIPLEEKQVVHWHIGQLLLQNRLPDQEEQNIFLIVDHLNIGRVWSTQALERKKLASLNLSAGKKAKASAAYQSAYDYLKTGLSLLDKTHWQTEYELILSLYTEAAEAAYLCKHFEEMEDWVAVVLEEAKTLVDKIKVYEIRINAYRAQNKMLEAIDIALPVLKQLGISLPRQPKKWHIVFGLLQTKLTLGRKHIESLKELPEMTDPEKLAAMRILAIISSISYLAAPDLLPLLIFKQINLSIKYGNTGISAFAYAGYGLILCGVLDDINKGYQFYNLSLTLLEVFDVIELKGRVIFLLNIFIKHWKKSIKNILQPLQEAYQSCLETGDLEYAIYAIAQISIHSYITGRELTQIEKKMAELAKIIHQLQQDSCLYLYEIHNQSLLNMRGKSNNTCFFSNEGYDEQQMLKLYVKTNNRNAIFYIYFNKQILCYLFHAYSHSLENAIMAENYLDGAIGLAQVPFFYFYDSLVRLALYDQATKREQRQYTLKIDANQKKIKKWAKHAPINNLHKFYLVEAERARVFGNNQSAMEYYDQAIALASEHEYLNDEALANELAGQFYMSQGQVDFAYDYLQQAHYAYSQWGAIAKVKDLEKNYPKLLMTFSRKQLLPSNNSEIRTRLSSNTMISNNSNLLLDFSSVLKASHAIASEIELPKLFKKLMTVIIENAGAQRGVLILQQASEWVIEADGMIEDFHVKMQQGLPVNQKNIPIPLINYVVNTKESVVLHDASHQGQFREENYFKNNPVQSVLCTPLLSQGQLIGLLYLENNLTKGAFTQERLDVLKVLSSQAVISLENALLYRTLEEKVEERTTQLAQANKEITALNKQLHSENIRMSAELEVSRQLQQMLLPKKEEHQQIETLEIAGFLAPADEVGGDYYDILNRHDRVLIGIGDVTGHGLESGAISIMVQTAVRTLLAYHETEIVSFFPVINETIFDNVHRMNCDKSMSLLLLEYQSQAEGGGLLRFSGQHEEIIMVQNGLLKRIDTIDLGFNIGIIDNITEFIAQSTIQLNPGDVIVLYTDGITEAKNQQKEEYGIERLCQVIELKWEKSVSDIQKAIINDMQQFISPQKPDDDITLLVLKQK
jgi:predicted ATPase/serine phosphatase RsbU (regulator of sigma subunit)